MILVVVLIAALMAAPPCTYDRDAMMALPLETFDRTKGQGWRPLADRPECRLEAADLLADDRKLHWATLRPAEVHGGYWHEGQLRAAAGQTKEAVRLLLAGVDPANPDDREDYALGTVAFLQHDLLALKAARARLAAQPEPAWFAAAADEGRRRGFIPTWPVSLDELDGFIACFDQPYAVAYSSACKPGAKPNRSQPAQRGRSRLELHRKRLGTRLVRPASGMADPDDVDDRAVYAIADDV